jgi:hypothetical protein
MGLITLTRIILLFYLGRGDGNISSSKDINDEVMEALSIYDADGDDAANASHSYIGTRYIGIPWT